MDSQQLISSSWNPKAVILILVPKLAEPNKDTLVKIFHNEHLTKDDQMGKNHSKTNLVHIFLFLTYLDSLNTIE